MSQTRWWLLAVAVIAIQITLSVYQPGIAQNTPKPTLANAPEDRQTIIANLEEIKNLLKQQNELLKSGDVKVIVTELPKK